MKSVGGSAFSTCTNLVGDLRLKCPELTSTGYAAFTNCRQLDSVDMGGSGIVTIGDYAFSGCWSMTNAVIPSGLQRIGTEAFLSNSSLRTVTPFLPDTVQSVGGRAFSVQHLYESGGRPEAQMPGADFYWYYGFYQL